MTWRALEGIALRFNRDYRLVIGIGASAVTIRPPINIQFDANKSDYGSVNKLNIKIYNLVESKRLKLVKDAEEVKYIPVKLEVGYQDTLEAVFIGNVQRGSNDRAGADFISSLECYSGMFDVANSTTNKTVRSKQKALDALLGDMPNTRKGKINITDQLTRPKVLVGGSYKLLRELADEAQHVYIDNEQLNIVDDDQVVSSFVPIVSATTGLINTPERLSQQVTFTTLMNPALRVRGLCELVSANAPHLNGLYKIRTINYKGDWQGQDWLMTCECQLAGDYKT